MLKYVIKVTEYRVNGKEIDSWRISAIIPEEQMNDVKEVSFNWDSEKEINALPSAPFYMKRDRKGRKRFKFARGLGPTWVTLKEGKDCLMASKKVYYKNTPTPPSINNILNFPDVDLAIQYLTEHGMENTEKILKRA